MYEIWLALNVMYELALANLPVVVVFLLLWLALMAVVLVRGRGNWRGALPVALLAFVIAAIASVFTVPSLVQSSLADMHYWVDWANLGAIAAGVGGAVALLVWPLVAGLARRG